MCIEWAVGRNKFGILCVHYSTTLCIVERTVNFPWLSCFFFKMTRKVIILTKRRRRRPSAAVQRGVGGGANTTEFHGFCLAPTPLLPPRSIPLTSSSFVPTYCWFEAYMQCAVCSLGHLAAAAHTTAAPPRYGGCALNARRRLQVRVRAYVVISWKSSRASVTPSCLQWVAVILTKERNNLFYVEE